MKNKTLRENIIKISILKDGDEATIGNDFAYMEFQGGNDPLVYNNAYGTSGFWSLEEVCEAVIKTYKGDLIEVHINL